MLTRNESASEVQSPNLLNPIFNKIDYISASPTMQVIITQRQQTQKLAKQMTDMDMQTESNSNSLSKLSKLSQKDISYIKLMPKNINEINQQSFNNLSNTKFTTNLDFENVPIKLQEFQPYIDQANINKSFTLNDYSKKVQEDVLKRKQLQNMAQNNFIQRKLIFTTHRGNFKNHSILNNSTLYDNKEKQMKHDFEMSYSPGFQSFLYKRKSKSISDNYQSSKDGAQNHQLSQHSMLNQSQRRVQINNLEYSKQNFTQLNLNQGLIKLRFDSPRETVDAMNLIIKDKLEGGSFTDSQKKINKRNLIRLLEQQSKFNQSPSTTDDYNLITAQNSRNISQPKIVNHNIYNSQQHSLKMINSNCKTNLHRIDLVQQQFKQNQNKSEMSTSTYIESNNKKQSPAKGSQLLIQSQYDLKQIEANQSKVFHKLLLRLNKDTLNNSRAAGVACVTQNYNQKVLWENSLNNNSPLTMRQQILESPSIQKTNRTTVETKPTFYIIALKEEFIGYTRI
eukprot:403358747